MLYFPGTLFHELSHYLAAVILRVPVASFTILPKITSKGVLFGQVSVQKVDHIRSALIAIAPLITGAAGLFIVAAWLQTHAAANLLTGFVTYIALCLINMMIPSRQDIKVAFPGILLVSLTLVCLILIYFLTQAHLY